MRIIGLTGKAGTGKDTVAQVLCSFNRLSVAKLALAAPIKEMVNVIAADIEGVTVMGQWNDRTWKEGALPLIGKSPRQLAQTLGTEWGRNLVNPDLWLIIAGARLEKFERHGFGLAIVTDVRFENEAAFIRKRGGEVWHVLRPSVEAVSPHSSEAGVALAVGDSIIDNSGDFHHLDLQVASAMRGERKVEAPRTAA